MSPMKMSLKAYICGVIGSGGLALVVALVLASPRPASHELVLATLVVSLTGLTYLAPVKLAPHRGVILDTTLQALAILALPPAEAALVCAAGVALGNRVFKRRTWFNSLFNTAQVALSVLAAATIYGALTPVSLVDPARTLRSALALLPAGAALYLVSHLAVDCAAAIQRRCSPFAGWFGVHGASLASHGVLVGIGAAVAPAIDQAPWLVLVAAAPVAAVRSVLRSSMEFDAEMAGVAERLAEAVAARDSGRRARLEQLPPLVRRVAQASGLAAEDCERVALAARLHDVGLAVAEAGPRTEADDLAAGGWQTGLRHAEATADYVARNLRLGAVAEVIRLHHEGFDGQGSGHGVAGKDIPLEARVLAVCDAWWGLLAGAGHRPALRTDQALVVLRAGAGTQWDPDVVERLAQVVESPRAVQRDETVMLRLAPVAARAVA